METQKTQFDADLDWQAFRYVAGEMSSAETATFERQMADYPAVCEAVAGAVELTAAVAAAEMQPVVSIAERPVAENRTAQWIALAVAACVMIAAFYFLTDPSSDWASRPRQSVAASANDEAGKLAAAWGDTFDRVAGDAFLGVDAVAEPSKSEVMRPEESESVELTELRSPSWMLEAIAGIAGADASNKQGEL